MRDWSRRFRFAVLVSSAGALLATLSLAAPATAAPPLVGVTVLSHDPAFSPEPGWEGPFTAAQEGVHVYPMVPTGFDPLTATNAELARYGLPQRPAAGGQGDAAWQLFMSHFKHEVPAVFYIDPRLSRSPHSQSAVTATSPKSIGGNQFSMSLNYSGNEDPPNGTTYTEAVAAWNVPTVTSTSTSSYSSTWVGMAGINGAQLVQDGTEQDWSSGKAHYSAWYEVCCTTNPTQRPIGLSVTANSSVVFQVNLIGTNVARFTACSGNTCIQPFDEGFSGPPGGGWANFIMERPTVNGKLPLLANYGQVKFSTAGFIQNNTFSCTGTPFHDDPHMYNSSNVQISEPTAFTDQNGCDFPILRVNPGQ